MRCAPLDVSCRLASRCAHLRFALAAGDARQVSDTHALIGAQVAQADLRGHSE